MSSGTLLSQFNGFLASHNLGNLMLQDMTNLFQDLHSGFLQFIYDAGVDSRLPSTILDHRYHACLLHYAAVQLCDDLSDDECSYIRDAPRRGPVLLMTLQNMFHQIIFRCSLTPDSIKSILCSLEKMGPAQYKELKTTKWNYTKAVHAADNLNGTQFSAYLLLLWDSSALAEKAFPIGSVLGRAVHIATDILSNDKRYWSLDKQERIRLSTVLKLDLDKLEQSSIPSVIALVRSIRLKLRRISA